MIFGRREVIQSEKLRGRTRGSRRFAPRFPVTFEDPVFPQRQWSLAVVLAEVQITRIAFNFSNMIPPPQGGLLCFTVGTDRVRMTRDCLYPFFRLSHCD